MRDYLVVTDLVARAGNGEKQAWDALVERYSPLIWSICRRHRLGDADAHAVGLRVWRQLVPQLDEVPDPGVLADWLAAAARRECGNVQSAAGALQISGEIADAGRPPSHQAEAAEHEWPMAERHAALREAFSRLSPCCQQLLTLLIDGPSVPDTEISARLGIPAGNIEAARHRCLDKLRRDPAIEALTSAGTMPFMVHLGGLSHVRQSRYQDSPWTPFGQVAGRCVAGFDLRHSSGGLWLGHGRGNRRSRETIVAVEPPARSESAVGGGAGRGADGVVSRPGLFGRLGAAAS